jgi:hypothetical protein
MTKAEKSESFQSGSLITSHSVALATKSEFSSSAITIDIDLCLRAVCGENNPEADLSGMEWDIAHLRDLESGEPKLFHSEEDEAAPWEIDP